MNRNEGVSVKGHTSYFLIVASVCLVIAAGCAAPTATPEPPAPTPVPPAAAAPDQLAAVKAWADAIYRGDVDAALSYFTDDGKYLVGEPAYGKDCMRQVFNWLAGLETKWEFLECLPDGDSITCSMIVLDGCRAASGPTGLPVKATFTLQDGKIKSVKGSTAGPEWNDYWSFFGAVRSWTSDNRAREFASLIDLEAGEDGEAGVYRKEAGAMMVKLCREYAAAAP